MNTKFAQIALLIATLFAGSAAALAQSMPASSSAKPTVIDAAVTDNRYQLYEGEVVKIDKKTRTITFKNKEGESKFVAGSDIIADIVEVNREKKLVSVKGPSGKITTVTVKNPALLADINVGEQVKVIYFDAMAASISTPKK